MFWDIDILCLYYFVLELFLFKSENKSLSFIKINRQRRRRLWKRGDLFCSFHNFYKIYSHLCEKILL